MNCNCNLCQIVLAVVILVFAAWPSQIFSIGTSQWIVIVAAILLIVHSLSCNKCDGICTGMMKGKKRK